MQSDGGYNEKINVLGLGYIGLPTALMLSAMGLDVTGSDFNENLIVTLNDGKTTFEENGLCDVNEPSVKSVW